MEDDGGQRLLGGREHEVTRDSGRDLGIDVVGEDSAHLPPSSRLHINASTSLGGHHALAASRIQQRGSSHLSQHFQVHDISATAINHSADPNKSPQHHHNVRQPIRLRHHHLRRRLFLRPLAFRGLHQQSDTTDAEPCKYVESHHPILPPPPTTTTPIEQPAKADKIHPHRRLRRIQNQHHPPRDHHVRSPKPTSTTTAQHGY